jgi:hypothetical protein
MKHPVILEGKNQVVHYYHVVRHIRYGVQTLLIAERVEAEILYYKNEVCGKEDILRMRILQKIESSKIASNS